MRDVLVLDRAHNTTQDLSVAVHEKPDAFLFKGTQISSLHAQICADCGFTELYADDPKTLWEALREQKSSH